MKKSVILIKKNFFVLNGVGYDYDKIRDIYDMLSSNIIIVIFEEELYIKKFVYSAKKSCLNEFICSKINNDFPQNGDILFDYEKRNNEIFVYSIRGAKRIEKLSKYARNLEVKPIQFIIKEVMEKYFKNSIFTAKILFEFEEIYYYISFKNGLFDYGFIEENKDLAINNIRNDKLSEIYVDEGTINTFPLKDEISVLKINIGELINEKIYKKQGFYSRKIL